MSSLPPAAEDTKPVAAMADLDATAIELLAVGNLRPGILIPIVDSPVPASRPHATAEVLAWQRRPSDDVSLRSAAGRRLRPFVEKHFSADSAAAARLAQLAPCVPART